LSSGVNTRVANGARGSAHRQQGFLAAKKFRFHSSEESNQENYFPSAGNRNIDHMKTSKLQILGAAALISCVAAYIQPIVNAATLITTVDGKTYHYADVLRTEPDGIIISYEPEQGGIGMAKLNFRNLPDSMRNQHGYDQGKATEFENNTAQGIIQWRMQQSSLEDPVRLYRNLAEIHRSVVGDQPSSLSISIEPDGKVSVQDQVQLYSYPYGYGYPWTSALATDAGFQPMPPYMPYAPYGPNPPYSYPGYAPYRQLRPTGY
jgi:hypothetical protein